MSDYPWDVPTVTHQPTLTADEHEAIKAELFNAPWNDPARFPECLTIAVETLGVVGLEGDEYARQVATQGLRSMLQRTLIGGPLDEPRGPNL